MRLQTFITSVVLAATAAAAFAADGPSEQWLQYASSDSPYESAGGMTGQQPRLIDKAPPGLELPKFQSDKPLLALWKVKLAKPCPRVAADGGIWLALDQSRKNGPYDLLYVDANASGSLADASPIKADATESYPDSNYEFARFRQVRFTLPGPDGPTAYHAIIGCSRSGTDRSVYVEPACWYEGPVTIDGRKLWCVLVDNNTNTRFDDIADSVANCDRIRVAPAGDKSFQDYTRDRTTHFVGKYFTYHKVRWQDEPNRRGSGIEKAILKALNTKQDWAAPHIKTGATWADAATEPGNDRKKEDA